MAFTSKKPDILMILEFWTSLLLCFMFKCRQRDSKKYIKIKSELLTEPISSWSAVLFLRPSFSSEKYLCYK